MTVEVGHISKALFIRLSELKSLHELRQVTIHAEQVFPEKDVHWKYHAVD